MNNLRKYLHRASVLFVVFVLGILGRAIIINAASVNVSIETEKSEVVVGDEIIVTINISSKDFIGDYETNLTYDNEMLEYISGSSVISGGYGFLKISNIDVAEGSKNIKLAIKFKALKTGVCDVGFTGKVMIFSFETGDGMPVSSEILTLKVNAQELASNNNYLKDLKVKPQGLEPNFSKKVFEYEIKVNKDINDLTINAIPEDEKSKVTVVGNKDLKEGDNKVIVTVISESGLKQDYIINTIKEFGDELGSNNPFEEFISDMEIIEFEGKIYAMLKTKYQIMELKNDDIIPSGYVRSQLSIGDITIESFSPENELDSDFILIYAINNDGGEGFYKYDRIEKTIQRYVEPEEISQESPDLETGWDKEELSKYKTKSKGNTITIIVCLIVILLLTVIVIRQHLKLKAYKED
ncbi:MAG TPA: hypothetical protein GXZ90_05525 [Clostridiales bacterium]|nr:hypothetical protein [Clostridiales bacterium]